jgi:hypothetical protein
MVSMDNIEIAFRRPNDIAALTKEEQEERCTLTDDTSILDGGRFFLRCTIPLPIHGASETYSIGAWAEISKPDFARVRELWNQADQTNEPAIDALLANHIPLTTGSLACRATVQLVSRTKRPWITVADEACSLFQEQRDGISPHRASEFSDLGRNPGADEEELVVVMDDELEGSACPCCDRTIRHYCGHITAGSEAKIRAYYWLRIPEGHGGNFTVAVSLAEAGHARVAVLAGEAKPDGITYRLLDRAQSPWQDFGECGAIMDRRDVLADPAKAIFFQMVDEVAAHDRNLASHVAQYVIME